MELELLKEKETPILSRKRYIYMFETDKSTPSRLELLRGISKKLNVPEKLIVIKHIYSQFGSNKVKIIVHAYKKEEDLKKFEHSSLLKKHKEKVKEGAEEKAEKKSEKAKKEEEE